MHRSQHWIVAAVRPSVGGRTAFVALLAAAVLPLSACGNTPPSSTSSPKATQPATGAHVSQPSAAERKRRAREQAARRAAAMRQARARLVSAQRRADASLA